MICYRHSFQHRISSWLMWIFIQSLQFLSYYSSRQFGIIPSFELLTWVHALFMSQILLDSYQFPQMMSMGCNMVPMMYHGVQHYMQQMGMGMGMEMAMNRPMMPFPSVLGGSTLPTTAAAAQLGQRYPMPTYHMPHMVAPDSSRIQANSQPDPVLNSLNAQTPNQPRVPIFAGPYLQYLHQMHMPPPQVIWQPKLILGSKVGCVYY